MKNWNWLGGVAIALTTLILSDMWREVRPTVFGWKWGEAIYAIATTPYAQWLLISIIAPPIVTFLFYRRHIAAIENFPAYLEVFIKTVTVTSVGSFGFYLLVGKAEEILEEMKTGMFSQSFVFIYAAVSMALSVFKMFQTGAGLQRRPKLIQ